MSNDLANALDQYVAMFDSAGFICGVKYGDNEFEIIPRPKVDTLNFRVWEILGLHDERPIVSAQDRKIVLARTGGECFYCETPMTGTWHVDHFIPRSKGGADTLGNYVPACPKCNLKKHAKMPTSAELERFKGLALSGAL